MATVTLLTPSDMSNLAETVSSFAGASTELDYKSVNSAAYLYGSFGGPLFNILGTATRALIDTADSSSAPNVDITNLSFSPASFSPYIALSVSQLVSDMLAGADTVIGSSGADTLLGFAGNDTLIGGAGGDSLQGGTNTDTASYVTAGTGVIAILVDPTFNTGDAAGDTYTLIENLTGSAFADILYANGAVNTLNGGGGNDRLAGLGGGDRFIGGSGSDTVTHDSSPGVRADLLLPAANTGDAAGDTYVSIENLDGSSFNDTLLGNNAANVIRGSTVANLPSGRDTLIGRGGNDTLSGFDDRDVLDGGLGRDRMTGGASGDVFDFNAVGETGKTAGTRDVITDFVHLTDDIDLRTIDANSNAGGNQAFSFIGTSAFHGVARELHVVSSGGNRIVEGDVNGDGSADFQIQITGNIALTSGDFLL